MACSNCLPGLGAGLAFTFTMNGGGQRSYFAAGGFRKMLKADDDGR